MVSYYETMHNIVYVCRPIMQVWRIHMFQSYLSTYSTDFVMLFIFKSINYDLRWGFLLTSGPMGKAFPFETYPSTLMKQPLELMLCREGLIHRIGQMWVLRAVINR